MDEGEVVEYITHKKCGGRAEFYIKDGFGQAFCPSCKVWEIPVGGYKEFVVHEDIVY